MIFHQTSLLSLLYLKIHCFNGNSSKLFIEINLCFKLDSEVIRKLRISRSWTLQLSTCLFACSNGFHFLWRSGWAFQCTEPGCELLNPDQPRPNWCLAHKIQPSWSPSENLSFFRRSYWWSFVGGGELFSIFILFLFLKKRCSRGGWWSLCGGFVKNHCSW